MFPVLKSIIGPYATGMSCPESENDP